MGFPTSEALIREEETRLNCTIPDVIRNLLIKNNGGAEVVFEGEHWQLFPVRDWTTRKHIKRTANNIQKETSSAKAWNGFPDNAIALGHNGSGDLIISFNEDQEITFGINETGEFEKIT